MNYKIGDKVKVKKGLVIRKWYGGLSFREEMSKYDILTINSVGDNYYTMDEDKDKYFWNDEMLEPAVRTLEDIQYGDVITDGEGYRYILDQHNEVVEIGYYKETIEEAKNAEHGLTRSLKGFIREFTYWKIVGQEQDIIELTIDDIAKLKGVSPDKIKIKK